MFFIFFIFCSSVFLLLYFILCICQGELREKIEKEAGGGPRAALSPILTSRPPSSRNMSELKTRIAPLSPAFEGSLNTNLMECESKKSRL